MAPDADRGGIPVLHHPSDGDRGGRLCDRRARDRTGGRIRDPAGGDGGGVLGLLSDRARDRLAAAADRAEGGEGPHVCYTARRWTTGPCRSEEHTSELQSLMRISYAVFCLKKKNK